MSTLPYLMPPEWAPHAATWLTWPKDPITWPDRVEKAQIAYCKMIEALTPHEKVHLLVEDEASKNQVLEKLKKFSPRLSSLHFHFIQTSDSWIRDYGPIFVKKNGEGYVALDFIFNAWGDKYESLKLDDDIPARLQSFLDMPVIHPGLILEGGSIDVNGKGTLLTTEQCLLNKNRNASLSKSEIEDSLKKYLGVSQILWLGEGIEGDDTDGHVDDITRFVSENVIVTAFEEDTQDANHEPLKENFGRLQAMKDAKGKSFEVVKIPMPGRLEREDGSRLPASYANFYIANKTVLTPIYHHKNDKTALEILEKLFPGRKVLGIDCRDLIWGMGAIHCLTQQQPL